MIIQISLALYILLFGEYITNDVSPEYLKKIESIRNDQAKQKKRQIYLKTHTYQKQIE